MAETVAKEAAKTGNDRKFICACCGISLPYDTFGKAFGGIDKFQYVLCIIALSPFFLSFGLEVGCCHFVYTLLAQSPGGIVHYEGPVHGRAKIYNIGFAL